MSDPTSETGFRARLAAGSESAANELVQRYRAKLCWLVEREMDRRLFRREDPEDVVQSALRSFFRGIEEGRFQIDHSGSLWALLEKVAMNKLLKHKEKQVASKRSPAKEVLVEAEYLHSRDPTPAEAALVTDLIQTVISGLGSPYPEIVRLRLQGCTETEIAQELGCGRQAVHYRLQRIRNRFESLLDDFDS